LRFDFEALGAHDLVGVEGVTEEGIKWEGESEPWFL
jgi:hypothetical protein